ncbi:uncharacterized protein LOC107874349 [Capsicum annuum]|uniref:uncharacterized protein LOC107874349 n=1 Tax=Capsicum annuum TaxID=4072 RepID=UPI001FB132DF|nr:uncharacterized protein LOC107874349 [Capsicum annuum]
MQIVLKFNDRNTIPTTNFYRKLPESSDSIKYKDTTQLRSVAVIGEGRLGAYHRSGSRSRDVGSGLGFEGVGSGSGLGSSLGLGARGTKVTRDKRASRLRVGSWNIGLDEEEKKEFWKVLDEVMRSIPRTEKFFMGGDFNRHIGSLLRGYGDVHGGFSFGERNEGGTFLLDFSRAFGLWIANSSFLKKEDHLITFRS